MSEPLSLERDLNRACELIDKLQKSNEIPPHSHKLLALQKVLKSDFFNAVREVYEHVHDTIDTADSSNSSPELRASATAKATVSIIIINIIIVYQINVA